MVHPVKVNELQITLYSLHIVDIWCFGQSLGQYWEYKSTPPLAWWHSAPASSSSRSIHPAKGGGMELCVCNATPWAARPTCSRACAAVDAPAGPYACALLTVDDLRSARTTRHRAVGVVLPPMQGHATSFPSPNSSCPVPRVAPVSHPIFRRKPNASHMCARITIFTHMIDSWV
jgi:hypothetical protein